MARQFIHSYFLIFFFLLIVGCESFEPIDCFGVTGGSAFIDQCGICGGNFTEDECTQCPDVTYVLLWGKCYLIEETYSLRLVGKNLSGSIPSSIDDLTKLTYLNLSNNQLTGELPNSLWNLIYLKD